MDSTPRNPPRIPATVPQSQSLEILKISPIPKADDTSVETTTPSANEDNAQPQVQPQSGILKITLHEGLGFSIPKRYVLLIEHDEAQEKGSESKIVKPAVGSSVDVSDAQNSQGNGHSREVGTAKRHSGVYAVLECEKSQVLVFPYSGTVESPSWIGHQCGYEISQRIDFSIHIYVRNPLSTPESGRTQDILLGVARSNHVFKNSQRGAQDLDEAETTTVKPNQGQKGTVSCTEWLELKHGTGKIHVSVDYSEYNTQPLRVEDFEIMQEIGSGKSRKTFQVSKRDGGRLWALKEIRKQTTASQAQDTDAIEAIELRVLSLANNPFIVPIKFVFQSEEKLYRYLVSPFVYGGELIQLLYKEQCSDMHRIKHSTAEIVCALEYLHDSGIVCRYLKPRHILLDFTGHISISSFALCQPHTKDRIDEACAPEIHLGQGYTQAADWWTLGILLADMLTVISRWPSWYEENILTIHSNIHDTIHPLVFPDFVPPSAQDLCLKLLIHDPKARLGANGVAAIKAHPFFDGIDWNMVLKRGYEPVCKANDAYFRFDSTPLDFPRPEKPISREETEYHAKKHEEMLAMFATRPEIVKMRKERPSGGHWTLPKRKEEEGSHDSIEARLRRRRQMERGK